MSEKVFLRWGDFHTAASNAFASLREDIYFADVTLACEDGHQIDAHKVVLVASSPIFRNLLRRSKLANPIIFMRGVGSENLEAIVDFIYRGEANVTQENLNSFLAFAQELKLEGLMGLEGVEDKREEEEVKVELKAKTKTPRTSKAKVSNNQETNYVQSFDEGQSNFTQELDGLDERIQSMMETSKLGSICKGCGKEGKRSEIKRHIESFHIEGLSIPCNLCNKTSKSRHALGIHKTINHKELL